MAHLKALQDKNCTKTAVCLPVDIVTEYNFLIQDLFTACTKPWYPLYKQTESPTGWLPRAVLLNLSAPGLNFLHIPSTPIRLATLSYY